MIDKSLKIKIQASLGTQNKLQKYINFKKSKVDYYTQMNGYLEQTLKNLKSNYHKKTVAKVTNSYKIKQLENEAICWRKPKDTHASQESSCKLSNHIKYLLKTDQQNKIQIAQLTARKIELMNKISAELQQTEPYIHEKIVKRIDKQSKKMGKIEVIHALERQIDHKKKWISSKTALIAQQHHQHKLQQSISSNLLKMKELGNKKLVIDQQVRANIPDLSTLQRKINKMRGCTDQIRMKIAEDEQKMEEMELTNNLQLNQINKPTSCQLLGQKQLQEINQTIKQSLKMLSSPLMGIDAQLAGQYLESVNQQLDKYKSLH